MVTKKSEGKPARRITDENRGGFAVVVGGELGGVGNEGYLSDGIEKGFQRSFSRLF